MPQPTQNDWVRIEEFSNSIAHIMDIKSLRRLLNDREANGSNYFCRKPAGILYLSLSRFYEWLDKEGKV